MRQVTHALLTRPPLGILKSIRKLQSKYLVRLACVKHAASVYPEPGSNSHVQFSVQFCANAFLSVCVSYLKDFTVYRFSLYYAKNFTRLTAFAIWLFKKSSGLVILFNYQGSLHSLTILETNGEEGIWTLAPLLTTYSLSRGAPSTSWVLLQA